MNNDLPTPDPTDQALLAAVRGEKLDRVKGVLSAIRSRFQSGESRAWTTTGQVD